jgi:primase-polymerase (primpol)-like protein
MPRWVLWRWEQRLDKTIAEMKWTKPPYQPDGRLASSTDPATWQPFNQALAAYERGGFSGIGFVVTLELGMVGVDLDHCREPEVGTIEPWAQAIIDRLDSYTEVTPSHSGIRIFLQGKLPPDGRKRGNVEMYESGRYLTVTGHHLEGTPTTIEQRQAEIEALHAQVFSLRDTPSDISETPHPPTVGLDDQELLARAMSAANGAKFAALWRGDTSTYGSHSEADLALCSHLAFWTGGDSARMRRLFRQCGLYRRKWDERHGAHTYGELTIVKALSGATAGYSQPFPKSRRGVIHKITVEVG